MNSFYEWFLREERTPDGFFRDYCFFVTDISAPSPSWSHGADAYLGWCFEYEKNRDFNLNAYPDPRRSDYPRLESVRMKKGWKKKIFDKIFKN